MANYIYKKYHVKPHYKTSGFIYKSDTYGCDFMISGAESVILNVWNGTYTPYGGTYGQPFSTAKVYTVNDPPTSFVTRSYNGTESTITALTYESGVDYYVAGDYIEDVVAPDGTYPDNGTTDNIYWYIKGGIASKTNIRVATGLGGANWVNITESRYWNGGAWVKVAEKRWTVVAWEDIP